MPGTASGGDPADFSLLSPLAVPLLLEPRRSDRAARASRSSREGYLTWCRGNERYPDTAARPGAAPRRAPQVTMSGNHVGKTMPPDQPGITVYATVRGMTAARLLTPA
jgi:hypothetical protein